MKKEDLIYNSNIAQQIGQNYKFKGYSTFRKTKLFKDAVENNKNTFYEIYCKSKKDEIYKENPVNEQGLGQYELGLITDTGENYAFPDELKVIASSIAKTFYIDPEKYIDFLNKIYKESKENERIEDMNVPSLLSFRGVNWHVDFATNYSFRCLAFFNDCVNSIFQVEINSLEDKYINKKISNCLNKQLENKRTDRVKTTKIKKGEFIVFNENLAHRVFTNNHRLKTVLHCITFPHPYYSLFDIPNDFNEIIKKELSKYFWLKE